MYGSFQQSAGTTPRYASEASLTTARIAATSDDSQERIILHLPWDKAYSGRLGQPGSKATRGFFSVTLLAWPTRAAVHPCPT